MSKDIRLAFCGKMKSGKDTACNHLRAKHGGETIHMFASGYRFVEWLMLYPIFGCSIDPENKTKFERLMLQWIGHWGRKLFGKDIWLNKTLKLIKKMPGNVYVTGVRYPNEVKRLKEIGVQSVWIDRPEKSRVDAGAFNLNHETETALDGFTAFDFKIPNDKDKTTFLRRVEAYGHIDSVTQMIRDSGPRGPFPVTTFMEGGNHRGFTQLDDGSIKGWQPSETDNLDPTQDNKDIAAKLKPLSGDLLKKLAIGIDAELIERRLSSVTFYNKYNSSASEIAQEIRRFADVVDHDLKVASGTTAVQTVRKNLHGILDNRGIPGEDRTGQQSYNPTEGADKDTTLLEIRRLAKSIGIDTKLVTPDQVARINTALAEKEQDDALDRAFSDAELKEAEEGVKTFELGQAELARRAKVERAKRDRYNAARKQRRAADREAREYKARGFKVKRKTSSKGLSK